MIRFHMTLCEPLFDRRMGNLYLSGYHVAGAEYRMTVSFPLAMPDDAERVILSAIARSERALRIPFTLAESEAMRALIYSAWLPVEAAA